MSLCQESVDDAHDKPNILIDNSAFRGSFSTGNSSHDDDDDKEVDKDQDEEKVDYNRDEEIEDEGIDHDDQDEEIDDDDQDEDVENNNEVSDDDQDEVGKDDDGDEVDEDDEEEEVYDDSDEVIKKEIIHWIRNEEDPIFTLLLGTRDAHSPLSLLRGLEDIALKKVMDWTVLPCSCCRNGPVAFCCRRQRKVVIDKNKEPSRTPRRLGEVPDSLFLKENVLLYEEGLLAGDQSSGLVSFTMPCSSWRRYRHHTYLAITDTGFYYDYGDKNFSPTMGDRKICLDWDQSAHVLVSAKRKAGTLSVEFIKDERNSYNDFLYTWRLRDISTPRIQEIFKLIQEKRRTVLDSSEYKDMLELISGGDDSVKELFE